MDFFRICKSMVINKLTSDLLNSPESLTSDDLTRPPMTWIGLRPWKTKSTSGASFQMVIIIVFIMINLRFDWWKMRSVSSSDICHLTSTCESEIKQFFWVTTPVKKKMEKKLYLKATVSVMNGLPKIASSQLKMETDWGIWMGGGGGWKLVTMCVSPVRIWTVLKEPSTGD